MQVLNHQLSMQLVVLWSIITIMIYYVKVRIDLSITTIHV